MNLQKKSKYIIILFIMLISCFIGFKSLSPSKPNYSDNSKTNVNNQMEHIKNIAQEPHSIFDIEAKEKVRDYLVSELSELGIESKLYRYDDLYEKRSDSLVSVENIYAEIKGKSDSYILLATHYDSSHAKTERYAEIDGSLGAADAGYALSTILETLRVIKEQNIVLENGIKILFTDGEEYGLLGAKEAVKESEILEGVNYVINIEARGTEGPAVMFETSPNNNAVLDLYKASTSPFSYSITPEIYRLLPNWTDFTVFLENNLTGINIAVLDGLENYHTPYDNPENLSEESMQHYGDQVLPIVTEFVTNEKYSNAENLTGNSDSIFFVLGNQFIEYSKTINLIFLISILVLIIYLYKKFNIKNIKNILKFTIINTSFTIIAMAIGYIISRLVAILNGREFKLTYLPLIKFEGILFITVLIVIFIAFIFTIKRFSRNFVEKNEFILGSLVLLLILSIIFTVVLPGASYLTVIPSILLSLFIAIKEVFNNIKSMSLIILIPISLVIILYVPMIYLFNCALTFGALAANVAFVMIAYISILTGIKAID